MPKLIIMPDVQDINHFLTAGNDKSKNDESNKIRENIISNILEIDEDYTNNSEYGEKWSQFKEKFISAVSPLCQEPYTKIKIKHMGGMSYNYDFLLTYYNEDNLVKEVKLEFKHNNSNVSDLVQFLELYDKDCKNTYEICPVSYAEFYYDKFLDTYLSTDPTINESKPDKEIYLKNVYDIKYKHPFFKKLHESKTHNAKEKGLISKNSIKKYINEYMSSFKFDKLADKIKESQKDKVFLLWDCNNFRTQILNVNELIISEIKKIEDLYFDVKTCNFQYDIRIRINWGNNNGLANPRWKFSFISKDK